LPDCGRSPSEMTSASTNSLARLSVRGQLIRVVAHQDRLVITPRAIERGFGAY
jgi:hypothetical protein